MRALRWVKTPQVTSFRVLSVVFCVSLPILRPGGFNMPGSEDNCAKCSRAFFGRQRFIWCSGPCKARFHLDCLKINDAEYEIFMKSGVSTFKCDPCIKKAKASFGDATLTKSISAPALPEWPMKPLQVKKTFEELIKAPSADREAVTIQLLNSLINMVYDLSTQVKDLSSDNAVLKSQISELLAFRTPVCLVSVGTQCSLSSQSSIPSESSPSTSLLSKSPKSPKLTFSQALTSNNKSSGVDSKSVVKSPAGSQSASASADDGFTVVSSRKNKSSNSNVREDPPVQRSRARKLLTGNKIATDLQTVNKVFKKKSLFVTRFSPEVSSLAIQSYLNKELNLDYLVCSKLKTKFNSYSSFHISVKEDDFPMINISDIWPSGCLIAPYYGKLLPEQIVCEESPCYIALRNSETLTLPHHRYLDSFKMKLGPGTSGISKQQGSYLKKKKDILESSELFVNILVDEVYVRPDVTYKGGKIEGMVIKGGDPQNDNIESRFGQYRQMSGGNYHISVTEILESERKIKAISLLKIQSYKAGEFSIKDLSLEEDEERDDKELTESGVLADCPNVYDEVKNLETSQNELMTLIYIAGYAVHKIEKLKNCTSCKNVMRFWETQKALTLKELAIQKWRTMATGGATPRNSVVGEEIIAQVMSIQPGLNEEVDCRDSDFFHQQRMNLCRVSTATATPLPAPAATATATPPPLEPVPSGSSSRQLQLLPTAEESPIGPSSPAETLSQPQESSSTPVRVDTVHRRRASGSVCLAEELKVRLDKARGGVQVEHEQLKLDRTRRKLQLRLEKESEILKLRLHNERECNRIASRFLEELNKIKVKSLEAERLHQEARDRTAMKFQEELHEITLQNLHAARLHQEAVDKVLLEKAQLERELALRLLEQHPPNQ
uniref:Zinc finger PHD-type domain-containing protein n=1 Tax=Timema tahoe TaxID=61484 RepID=A0A7R9IGB9_9NEOP|nr:unnamed protein product [Timema tahoe]